MGACRACEQERRIPSHLIVARHVESAEWAQAIEGWRVLVVQKDRDLPNEGREASSYFWAFHHLYERLSPDDRVACVQGDPFAHDNSFPASLEIDCQGFEPLGHWHVECDLSGAPHHPGLPLADSAWRWFGLELPDRIHFTAGAQFMVPGRLILKHPRAFHMEMVGRMSEPLAPWVMERLWELWLGS